MNVFGIILIVGFALLAGYLVYTLVRDIRDKIKNKGDKDK